MSAPRCYRCGLEPRRDGGRLVCDGPAGARHPRERLCPESGKHTGTALPHEWTAPLVIGFANGSSLTQSTCLRCGVTDCGPLSKFVTVRA